MATPDLTTLDEKTLVEWLLGRRWFGSKAEDVAHVGVLDSMPLDDTEPGLLLALLEARFPTGTHHVYQLLFGVRPAGEGWTETRVEDVDGATIYDAFSDPDTYRRLGRMLAEQRTIQGEHHRPHEQRAGRHLEGQIAERAAGLDQPQQVVHRG